MVFSPLEFHPSMMKYWGEITTVPQIVPLQWERFSSAVGTVRGTHMESQAPDAVQDITQGD